MLSEWACLVSPKTLQRKLSNFAVLTLCSSTFNLTAMKSGWSQQGVVHVYAFRATRMVSRP